MVSLNNLNGNLASVGTTVLGPPTDTAVRSGAADPDSPLSLAAPGIGYEGSVDVELDVGPWLEFDWTGSGEEDPQGSATFGRYRGHDRIIFRLEKR